MSSGSRQGFVLLVSILVLLVVMTLAFTAQSVAMRNLEHSSLSLVKTRAYLNAVSGIEAALGRLKTEPNVTRLESWNSVAVPTGDYQVNISAEVAEAFGAALASLPPNTPVYLLEAIGRSPMRGDTLYGLRIVAVVRLAEGRPQILLWSEHSGAGVSPENK